VGIVNRSQADINRSVDMIAARRREREFFTTSPDYSHLASQMGSEYLARILSKVSIYLTLVKFCMLAGHAFLLIFFCCPLGWLLIELIWFQHLESLIRVRIPRIASLINKNIDELVAEMTRLGRPVAVDAGVRRFFFLPSTTDVFKVEVIPLI